MQSKPILGAAFYAASVLLLAILDLLIKLSTDYTSDFLFVVAFRFLIGLALITVLDWIIQSRSTVPAVKRAPEKKLSALFFLGMRSFSLASMMVFFFLALKYVSLTTVTSIALLSPIITFFSGMLLFNETLHRSALFALFLAVLGAVVLVGFDYGTTPTVGLTFALIGSISITTYVVFSKLTMRYMTEHRMLKSTYVIVGALTLTFFLVFGDPSSISTPDIYPVLFAMAVVGCLSNYLAAYGVKRIELNQIACWDCTIFFWALCFDVFLLSEQITLANVAGAALICTSAILISRTKRRYEAGETISLS